LLGAADGDPAARLVERANAHGGRDNIAAVVVEVTRDPDVPLTAPLPDLQPAGPRYPVFAEPEPEPEIDDADEAAFERDSTHSAASHDRTGRSLRLPAVLLASAALLLATVIWLTWT
jgi:hypothetical protein